MELNNKTAIEHDENRNEFSMNVDGQKVFINYHLKNDIYYLTHSEVPQIFRGKGIGKILVKATYDFLNKNSMTAVPVCSFIKAVVSKENL